MNTHVEYPANRCSKMHQNAGFLNENKQINAFLFWKAQLELPLECKSYTYEVCYHCGKCKPGRDGQFSIQ